MGCGQSKIHLYPKKSKSKSNGKKGGHIDGNGDVEETEGYIESDINKDKERIEDDSLSDQGSPDQPNNEISISLLRAKNLSLLQSQEISSSQQNFFRMLDKKIEDGPDYDSSSETEMALEEARLNALVQHWESASLTASMCSSTSRSLQGTPVRQTVLRPLDQQQVQQSQNQIQLYGVANVRIVGNTTIRQRTMPANVSNTSFSNINSNDVGNILPQHISMTYYTHSIPPQLPYCNDGIHSAQVPQIPSEPRFPPSISVQRLAPQVQRQLRETQELIKDACPQLYAAGYNSPGPPIRAQQRQQQRRPTLETQFSQELS